MKRNFFFAVSIFFIVFLAHSLSSGSSSVSRNGTILKTKKIVLTHETFSENEMNVADDSSEDEEDDWHYLFSFLPFSSPSCFFYFENHSAQRTAATASFPAIQDTNRMIRFQVFRI